MTMISLKTVKDLRIKILGFITSTCYCRTVSISNCGYDLIKWESCRDGISESFPPPCVCPLLSPIASPLL